MRWRFLLPAALLAAAPAHAGEPAAKPCERGAATIMLPGLDIDQMRCQLELDAERMGSLEALLGEARAQVLLLKADLAAARTQLAEARGKLPPAVPGKPH